MNFYNNHDSIMINFIKFIIIVHQMSCFHYLYNVNNIISHYYYYYYCFTINSLILEVNNMMQIIN